jgi:hypothetical protein
MSIAKRFDQNFEKWNQSGGGGTLLKNQIPLV